MCNDAANGTRAQDDENVERWHEIKRRRVHENAQIGKPKYHL